MTPGREVLFRLQICMLKLLHQRVEETRPQPEAFDPDVVAEVDALFERIDTRAAHQEIMAEIGEPRDRLEDREAGQRWSSGQAEFVLMSLDRSGASPIWKARALTGGARDTQVSDIALRKFWKRVS